MEAKLTLYSKAEDLKRLKFISGQIQRKIAPGGKVLDVGCGNGNVSIYLGEQGYVVKGIDISPDAITVARKRNPFKNVQFDVVAAEELRNTGDKFSAIVCSEVLEHLDEPNKLVKVLFSLLKDDGVLIVTVPNGYGPRELFMTKPMQAINQRGGIIKKLLNRTKRSLGYNGTTVQSAAADLTHVQFFTKKTLTRLARHSNFAITTFKSANFIEAVFPYSILTKRIPVLQRVDCTLADYLPVQCSSGFYTVWHKNISSGVGNQATPTLRPATVA